MRVGETRKCHELDPVLHRGFARSTSVVTGVLKAAQQEVEDIDRERLRLRRHSRTQARSGSPFV